MIRVEPDVNRSIEDYTTPSSGVCRSQCPRKPASISRHQSFGDATHQTICAGAQFTQPLVLFCFKRAKLTTQVATGFVRRGCFSLNLVCRTRLDREFAHEGGYA